MTLEFINRSKSPLPRAMLSRWVEDCIRQLPKKDQRKIKSKSLLVLFISDKDMKALNFEYRGKAYPTDVLSFEPIEDGSLGEVVLAPNVLKKQAIRVGHSYKKELCYMVLHGLLHLLGYDHETSEKDAKVMFGLQDKIFAQLAGRFKFR